MKTADQLQNFLEAYKCLESFNANLMYDDIEDLCKNTDPRRCILIAFPWEETSEGVEYWHAIDAYWTSWIIMQN